MMVLHRFPAWLSATVEKLSKQGLEHKSGDDDYKAGA